MKKRVVAAAAATVVVAVGAGSASGADYIYWTSGGQASTIARAQTSGSGLENAFITLPAQTMPLGIAVTGTKIAWMSGTVSPYDLSTSALDGSGVVSTSLTNSNTPDQFAVQGSYVFYPAYQGKLGRVGLDGIGANSAFTAVVFPGQGAPNVTRVTSDANYLYAVGPGNDRIARMTLAGVLDNETFITGLSGVKALAVTDKYIFWITNQAIGRANIAGTDKQPTLVQTAGNNQSIAVGGDYVYWGHVQGQTRSIGRVKIDGTDKTESFISGLTGMPTSLAVTPGAGSAPAPTPTPTPTPAPTTPAATTLATPTVNTSAPGQNAVVTVRAQLGAKGKYTFIFERPTSNEMSREQATSSRVAMQKGTRIGKRTLKKRYTAAVITTTADNAKVVTRALLRKAQARKLNLRVVYAPTGTAQSESVIKIK